MTKSQLLVAAALLCLRLAASSQDKKPRRQFELAEESTQFWKLFARDVKLETIASGFGFTEGPVWDRAGFLYVSDEELNKIFRVYGDGRKEELISLGDPDGNTYDLKMRLIDWGGV